MNGNATVVIKYVISRQAGDTLEYVVRLDSNTGDLVAMKDEEELPMWTKLECHQCPGCPLTPDSCERCPVAVNIHKLIDYFKYLKSYDTCDVRVETNDRTYLKSTDIQTALRSLLGLVMAASGCPKLDFLRPMARFHLPFSTMEETVFRSVGSFLIGNYFRDTIHSADDVNALLGNFYKEVNQLNSLMLKRISQSAEQGKGGDANPNAIVILHCMASLLTMELKHNISSLKNLYHQ